ncbi:hypothetical protein AB4Y87_19915 [Paenarthrobacter sp. RAF54_2]|uniref:hypothetical protein n=1 Tax=Paenarthrobacter sp. RAF54_2 TaxID=3233061 RepID=UPI003F97A4B6
MAPQAPSEKYGGFLTEMPKAAALSLHIIRVPDLLPNDLWLPRMAVKWDATTAKAQKRIRKSQGVPTD